MIELEIGKESERPRRGRPGGGRSGIALTPFGRGGEELRPDEAAGLWRFRGRAMVTPTDRMREIYRRNVEARRLLGEGRLSRVQGNRAISLRRRRINFSEVGSKEPERVGRAGEGIWTDEERSSQ